MYSAFDENFFVSILSELNPYRFIALDKLGKFNSKIDIAQLPFCLRVVFESNLRHCKNEQELRSIIDLFVNWQESSKKGSSISIYATRVLMQDYTGIPVLVDLCALRQAAINKGINPELINPKIPVDLIVDHSIVVNSSGNSLAANENSRQQYEQNIERFSFLKWVSHAFKNLRIIPPDSGICHQVNLESLATAYVVEQDDESINIFPELPDGAIITFTLNHTSISKSSPSMSSSTSNISSILEIDSVVVSPDDVVSGTSTSVNTSRMSI